MTTTRMMHLLTARMAADTLAKELTDLGLPKDAERVMELVKNIEAEWRSWWESKRERLGI